MTLRLPLFGVLKQWNNGHVGVPNQSFGTWTFYEKTFFGFNKFAKLLSRVIRFLGNCPPTTPLSHSTSHSGQNVGLGEE